MLNHSGLSVVSYSFIENSLVFGEREWKEVKQAVGVVV